MDLSVVISLARFEGGLSSEERCCDDEFKLLYVDDLLESNHIPFRFGNRAKSE